MLETIKSDPDEMKHSFYVRLFRKWLYFDNSAIKKIKSQKSVKSQKMLYRLRRITY
jgi:hypothetical protein